MRLSPREWDAAVAQDARYVGSPEHKDTPSFAGRPRPRADASLCDPRWAGKQEELTALLRRAIEAGQVGGPVEGRFPRYVWCRLEEDVYEARLVNRGLGEYKAYRLLPDEWPPEMRS